METVRKNAAFFSLGVLAVAAAFIWYAVFYFESRQDIRVTFFDVGQGDAVFIEVPNGNQVLIDGGPGDAVLAKLGRVLPFWDRSIDLLVLTHPHADHLDGAFEVLKRYRVGMVVESGVHHSIPEYGEWHDLLREKNVKVVVAKAGQHIIFSHAGHLDIFAPFKDFTAESPKNVHDATVVSKLYYGSTTALLTGDAERQLEYQLMFSGADLKSDILKVGHHGSKTSSFKDFLAAVSPEIAVIQVGKKNRYGHPYQEVLERLAASHIEILRTDTDRDIIFASDGYAWARR